MRQTRRAAQAARDRINAHNAEDNAQDQAPVQDDDVDFVHDTIDEEEASEEMSDEEEYESYQEGSSDEEDSFGEALVRQACRWWGANAFVGHMLVNTRVGQLSTYMHRMPMPYTHEVVASDLCMRPYL